MSLQSPQLHTPSHLSPIIVLCTLPLRTFRNFLFNCWFFIPASFMALGCFGTLWRSWKWRPLSSGVVASQAAIASTGVAQTGNANDTAPASDERTLEGM
ncbi:hypothetical protein BKA82DRAFT_4350973 [Pisolithus tinctorius]|nr:hypothetical protein BKA82DRAFT_4350973 [Pisolithus tinctorius]